MKLKVKDHPDGMKKLVNRSRNGRILDIAWVLSPTHDMIIPAKECTRAIDSPNSLVRYATIRQVPITMRGTSHDS